MSGDKKMKNDTCVLAEAKKQMLQEPAKKLWSESYKIREKASVSSHKSTLSRDSTFSIK